MPPDRCLYRRLTLRQLARAPKLLQGAVFLDQLRAALCSLFTLRCRHGLAEYVVC
jgi:hypothetical protein